MEDPVEIYVLNRRVRLRQPPDGFRTSLDSVMLAAACPARAGDRVLDMGCGVGGAGFCVLSRIPGIHITGVDIQADHIDLARQNISLNKAENTADFSASDIRDFQTDLTFNHVICNPPYLESGTHTPSPDIKRAMAHGHLTDMDVGDWIDAGFHHVASGGSLTLIHRADHIDKIIRAMGKRFGAIEIIPLWPYAGQAAKRVIIRAIKNRRTPATLHAGIVLHDIGGGYTDITNSILRDMAPIP
jgi:tRNA1(Val) A37 N6-methylase TrmN6